MMRFDGHRKKNPMSDLAMVPVSKTRALGPNFPKPRGLKRVGDYRVLSGIIFVNRNGMRWRNALRDTVLTRRLTTVGSVGVAWLFSFG